MLRRGGGMACACMCACVCVSMSIYIDWEREKEIAHLSPRQGPFFFPNAVPLTCMGGIVVRQVQQAEERRSLQLPPLLLGMGGGRMGGQERGEEQGKPLSRVGG